jgi:hypothetical protein
VGLNLAHGIGDLIHVAPLPQEHVLRQPDLALLKVDVERAEYWDAPSGTMAEIAGLFEIPDAGGENETVDLTGSGG